jgi:hypothetical protein
MISTAITTRFRTAQDNKMLGISVVTFSRFIAVDAFQSFSLKKKISLLMLPLSHFSFPDIPEI